LIPTLPIMWKMLEYLLCTIGLQHKYQLDTLGTLELWRANGHRRQSKPLMATHKVDEQVIMISEYAMSSIHLPV
jgi:hypothetical protein